MRFSALFEPAATSTSSGYAARSVADAAPPDRHEERRTRNDHNVPEHEARRPQDHRPHRRGGRRPRPRPHPGPGDHRRGKGGAERAQGARLPRHQPGRRGPAAVRRLLRPADLRAPDRARRGRRAERAAGRQRERPGQSLAHRRDLRAQPAAGQHAAQHHRPVVRGGDPDRQRRRRKPEHPGEGASGRPGRARAAPRAGSRRWCPWPARVSPSEPRGKARPPGSPAPTPRRGTPPAGRTAPAGSASWGR